MGVGIWTGRASLAVTFDDDGGIAADSADTVCTSQREQRDIHPHAKLSRQIQAGWSRPQTSELPPTRVPATFDASLIPQPRRRDAAAAAAASRWQDFKDAIQGA
jgi:hypothetical protein